ncbi:MAG: CARDB domain-containing protein, partial [Myxococcota bacterium]
RLRFVAVQTAVPGLPDGPYFVGAVVDENNIFSELIETNNITVVGPVGFGNGPDLVVEALAAPPSADTAFTGNLTVCNQGTDFSGATDVLVYASTDAVIDTSPTGDFVAGGASVPALQAGKCALVTTMLFPPPGPPGAFNLGAIVDPANFVTELVDTNNTKIFGPFGFGSGPDLAVTDVVTPPSADGAFNASVTVCNQGTVPSGPDSVTLYASTDALIESTLVVPFSTDFPLGGTSVPGLDAGQCTVLAVAGISPPTFGPFFVGAIVDEQQTVAELVETNNVKVVGPVGFGSGVDLVINAMTIPSILNGPQTANVEVCNVGTLASPGSDVSLAASSFPMVQPFPFGNDFDIGGQSVPPLAAGACATVGVQIAPPPLPTPTAYIKATVDPLLNVSELVETSNARTEGPFGIGSGFDLRVASVTGPTFASPGQEITVSVRVCNDGDSVSPPNEVELFASADAVLDTRGLDPSIGFAPIPGITPQSCVDTAAPTAGFSALDIGTWNLGANVDPLRTVSELIETNNASLGGQTEIATVFCGNGVVDAGEACDDGNFVSGDGCTATCVVEFCGDGIINNGGTEICDDGNTAPFDGCSPACMPQGALLGEVIQLSSDQVADTWYSASFGTALTNPVVVGNILSFNGSQPAHLRVRNVSDTGFEWQMEEWAYLDGNHILETLPFIAVNAGNHTLEDGTRMEANTTDTTDAWTTVSFSTPFASPPVLLTGVMSDNDSTPVVVRVRNLTASGFEVRVQEEEGQDGTHASETVAFVAMEAGTGVVQGLTFEAGRTPDAVRHPWYRVDFSAPFTLAPVFLASMDRADGGDTAGLRFRNATAGSVEIKVEEEQSANSETGHTTESVSWTAWSAPGPLVAAP